MTTSLASCAIPHRVLIETGPGGLERCQLVGDGGSATVYAHGAHISAFTPAGQTPVLWMSDHSWYAEGKPLRGGIPVCWPWFGPHPLADGRPTHGVARISVWSAIDSAVTADGRVRLRLGLTVAPEHQRWITPGLRAEITITVGNTLEVDLDTINDGQQPASIEDALHTYFAVSDIHSTTVEGLDGAVFIDKCQNLRLGVQSGAVSFTGETDRVYHDHAPAVTLVDNQRRIHIAKQGSANTVVWNPWMARAAAIADLGDHEWSHMACVETANCLSDCIVLLPGNRHRTHMTISVESNP